MRYRSRKCHSGVTLVELAITMAVASILVLAVGALLVSGQRGWNQTYNSTHKKIKVDALTTTTAFGAIGRKANRLNYVIYNISGDTFTPAVPVNPTGVEVVSGDAVEFRYWDVELDSTDSHGLLDVTKMATAYALFYIDGDKLKVDYGPYPPGAVPDGGGNRNTTGVTTTIMAENISTDDGDYDGGYNGGFSHTTINGTGRGCVRINIVLRDPDDGQTVKVTTATLPRNIWPR